MKQYTSVMALAVRALLGKVLAVTAATTALQLVLSRLILSPDQVADLASLQQAGWTPLIAVLGLAGILALEAFHGSPLSGVRTGYTLQRLPVREQTVAVLWAVVYLGFLLLFWAAEVGVSLLQLHWVSSRSGSQVPAFLRFAENYSSWFFHNLLPLYDWPRILRNGVWLIALAWSAAAFSYHQRRGSFRFGIVVILVLGALLFGVENGSTLAVLDLVFTFLIALVTVWSCLALREGEKADA